MPFQSNSELIKKVPGTDKLSPKKQDQFRAVWNSCFKDGKPEQQCYQIAWGVVKKASGEGQIIGPAESQDSVADAIKTKDILDASDIVRDILSVAKTIRELRNEK